MLALYVGLPLHLVGNAGLLVGGLTLLVADGFLLIGNLFHLYTDAPVDGIAIFVLAQDGYFLLQRLFFS